MVSICDKALRKLTGTLPSRWLRSLPLLLVCFLPRVGWAQASQVAWVRVPTGCAAYDSPTNELHTIRCGEYGKFVVDFGGSTEHLEGCDLTEAVQESPTVYPTKAPGISLIYPCHDDSCLVKPPYERPWAAVIDTGFHGRLVSATLRDFLEDSADVALFDLDAFPHPDSGPTDLNLLHGLCAIVEAIDEDLDPPPVVINLSFGRKPLLGEEVPCENGNDRSMSCEVRRVLNELTDRHAIPIFAAAGNHRLLLFPAAYTGVTAVGAMDVTHFRKANEFIASWETPAEDINFLMGGHGICLDDGSGQLDNLYALPPGSSFACAVAAATWGLGRILNGLTGTPNNEGTWGPVWHCEEEECTFEIVNEADTRLTVGALGASVTGLLERLKTPGSRPGCGDFSTSSNTPTGGAKPATMSVNSPLPPSYIQRVGEGLDPQPGSNPCGACLGRRSQDELIIDRSGSNGSTAPINEVYVRRQDLGLINPVNSSELITALESSGTGHARQIIISFPENEDPSAAASLVYKKTIGGEPYWSSEPILVTP